MHIVTERTPSKPQGWGNSRSSEENVKTARVAVNAVAQMDLSRLLEVTDPDVDQGKALEALGLRGVAMSRRT